jgi:LysM repeat protein
MPSDATITITKNVEVYSYEDLTFTVDSYEVNRGDNLEGVLKDQGLWPADWTREREAQLMRLISELNPAIANLDLISPGQTLYLPRAQAQPLPPPEPDPTVVVSYALGSNAGQSPATVVVRRTEPDGGDPGTSAQSSEEPLPEGTFRLVVGDPADGPGTGAQAVPADGTAPGGTAQGSGPQAQAVSGDRTAAPAAPAPAQAVEPAVEEQAPEPARASRRRQRTRPAPSNEGELSTTPDGTVYRTVKVRSGDTLERLLKREGLDPELIYRHLIRLTVDINPGLKNPHMIMTGAELRIPAIGPYLAAYGGGPELVQVADASSQVVSDAAPAVPPARRTRERQRTRRPDRAQPAAEQASAPAPSGGRFRINTARLPAAPLPTADAQNAKQILSLIFTRLGEQVSQRGRLFLPLDEPPHFDVDTSTMPVVDLKTGRHIILDLNRSLPEAFITRFRAKYPEYVVFQPARGERMEKALERLWPMCGYFRVYPKGQAFEGGKDVKIRISADWLVWPTSTDWNRGQPVVINLAPAPDNGTPLPWVRFLADHNISVIDLYRGEVLAGGGKAATPINNFTVVDADSDNPSAFAEAFVKALGFNPRIGVSVDLAAGRVTTGGATIGTGPPPAVFWESGNSKTILEYGDLTTDELDVLKRNGFSIISSARDSQTVLRSIVAALKIRLEGPLVLNGDSSGGPSIKLTVAGQTFTFGDRTYLFTSTTLPESMTGLDPNQTVVVIKYKGASPAAPAPVAAGAPPAQPVVQPAQPAQPATGTQAGEAPASDSYDDSDGPSTVISEDIR